MKRTILIGIAVGLVLSGRALAQPAGDASWRLSAQLSLSLIPGDAEWSISHPYYGGGGTTWETFTGRFRHRVHAQASLELRRRYVGIRGTVGILPQEFIQDSPAQRLDLKLLLAGVSAVFYPMAGTGGDVEPFLAVGAGGQKATGDMTNTGFYLSGTAGIRVGVGPRLAIDTGLQVQRLKYTQIEVGSQIAKDVAIRPASLFLGVRIAGPGSGRS